VDAQQRQRYAFCGWHARESGCIVYAFCCRETPDGIREGSDAQSMSSCLPRHQKACETLSFKIVCQPSPIWPGPDVPFQPSTVGWREARLLEAVRFNKARGFHSRAHMVACMKLLKSQPSSVPLLWSGTEADPHVSKPTFRVESENVCLRDLNRPSSLSETIYVSGQAKPGPKRLSFGGP
jgi:hypothetical protein